MEEEGIMSERYFIRNSEPGQDVQVYHMEGTIPGFSYCGWNVGHFKWRELTWLEIEALDIDLCGRCDARMPQWTCGNAEEA